MTASYVRPDAVWVKEMKASIFKRAALLLIATSAFGGCTRANLDCSSESAKSALLESARKDIGGKVSSNLKDLDELNTSGVSFGKTMISQMVDKFDLELADVSELWANAEGDGKSCRGTLTVTVDANQIKRAGDARSVLDMITIADLATQSAIEFDGHSRLTQDIDFSLNLADNGNKVRADVGASFTIFDAVAEITAYNLLSAAIIKNKRDEELQEKEAEGEQQRAAIALARAENRMAVKAIGEVWSSLLPETRTQLVGLQKAWIRKKNADCRVEAFETSEDKTNVEVNQLKCDTRTQLERLEWLRRYVPVESGF